MAAEEKIPLGEVMLMNVRLSFVDLITPSKPKINKKTGETIPGRYHANLLLPKTGKYAADTKANLAKIKAAADEVKKAKWNDKIPIIKPDKLCLRDGNFENWEGYADHFYVSANNENPPVLIDNQKDEDGKWIVLTQANGGAKKLYAGAWVRALIRIWAQDNEHGKRVNASIESVQFLRHGEAFSGGGPIDPNKKFDELPEDAIEADDEMPKRISPKKQEEEEYDSLI